MADEITPEFAKDFGERLMEKYLENAADLHFKPYVKLISEGLTRNLSLITRAADTNEETAAEILRAVVVLNHAYLEDFLRSVALWLLPTAEEEVLNDVPLSGFRRAEKFSLGKLAQHKGKKIDDLIEESVAAYMSRFTFSDVTEIMSFLDSVNVKISYEGDLLPGVLLQVPVAHNVKSNLEHMMTRRHQIVHRADRDDTGTLQGITEQQVLLWLISTLNFTLGVATAIFAQHHGLAQFRDFVAEEARTLNK